MDDRTIEALLRGGDETAPVELRAAVRALVRDPSMRHTSSDRIPRSDQTNEEAIMFDLIRGTRSADRPERGLSGWIVAAVAAAAVAVVVVVAVVAGRIGDDSAPADAPTTPITTPDTLPLTDTAIAESFIAALDDRDVVAADALVASDASISVAQHVAPSEARDADVTLEEQIAFLTAWDWRWDDVECSADPGTGSVTRNIAEGDGAANVEITYDGLVRCQATARTNLGDVDEVSQRYRFKFFLLDGEIVYADRTWGGFGMRWMLSLPDFIEWGETERLDLWEQSWWVDGPWTMAAAEISAQLLDEYIALLGDDSGAGTVTTSTPSEPTTSSTVAP